MNNIIAIIPARSGSKSIPDKNIKLLGNRSLLTWSIEVAFKSGIQRVIVSTDSENYAKVAREAGAEVLIRPAELALDTTSMYEVLKSEIPKIDPIPELVVLLQPTTPFRKAVQIKLAIDMFSNQLDRFDSLISVERVPEKYNPAHVILTSALGARMANGSPIAQRITNRQAEPAAYLPTGAIYLFKTSNLEKGSFYGDKVMLLETDPAININSPTDWLIAEEYLNGKR